MREKYMEVWKEMYGGHIGHIVHLTSCNLWKFLMIEVFEVMPNKFEVTIICILENFHKTMPLNCVINVLIYSSTPFTI